MHWSAGYPVMVGLGKIREFWVPELIAMGVKWVKIANHDGGEPLAELLLENGIMPIVRLYRPQPNPGVLGQREIDALDRYLAVGVKYFEFNNEPDLSVEWIGGHVPPPEDAVRIVAENAICDMDLILSKGGYPAVPALATGTKWDIIGAICALGRNDLFEGGVWHAIHNYTVNHPLDYPYDDVNQQGTPMSAEEYERWQNDRWDDQAAVIDPLERINQWRRADKNPGATIHDDPSAWRSYEFFDALAQKWLGRSIPILSTEGGCSVTDGQDRRYPRISPTLHRERHLEMCRIMMGTSTRFEHAPDYYFCTGFWLLGNYTLASWAAHWEGQAWYSPKWPNGHLPIVEALKVEPKRARPMLQPAAGPLSRSVVQGTVAHGAGRQLTLRSGEWSRTTTVADNGRYYFGQLPAGVYTLTVEGTDVVRDSIVTDGQNTVTVDLDLGPVVLTGYSVIQGTVVNGVGREVILRSGELVRETPVADDGTYRFANLPAGQYSLLVEGTNVGRSGVVVDGHSVAVVDLALPDWLWHIDGPPTPSGGAGIIRCSVVGRKGLAVKLYGPGWGGITGLTGTKPEYGEFACEFSPLREGTYFIEPEGLGTTAEVHLEAGTILTIEFEPATPAAAPTRRALRGKAPAKKIAHYLFVGQLFRDTATQLAVLRYVSRFSPVVGNDLAQAKKARYVTILGGSRAVSATKERELREAGCEVERIETDIAKTLDRLVAKGRRFVGIKQ